MERFRGEIKERLGVTVFSGDTQENFIRGASLRRDDVVFDKTKIPRPAYPELFVDRTNKKFPLHRALYKAKELGHAPLIIEGRLSRFSPQARSGQDWVELPLGFLLPVNAVWVPRTNLEWSEVDVLNDKKDILPDLERIPAKEYLKNFGE